MVSCEFSNCVYWDGAIKNCDDAIKPISNWDFSKMVCSGDLDFSTSSVPAYLEKKDSFFIQNSFSLGEIIFLAVLIPAIFVFLLVKIREFLKNKYQ
jgi:hypothetical protein